MDTQHYVYILSYKIKFDTHDQTMLIKKNKQTQQQQQTKQAPFSSCSGGALTILHDLHQLMEIFYHDRIVDVQVSIFPEHFT